MKMNTDRVVPNLPLLVALIGTLLTGISPAFGHTKPNFGPNVYIIDPTMTAAQVQSTLVSLFNEAQFSTNRYAVFFMPGAYNVQAPIGYYESIAGLGQTPGAVTE